MGFSNTSDYVSTTSERVRDAAKLCPDWERGLRVLYPMAFKEEKGSIYLNEEDIIIMIKCLLTGATFSKYGLNLQSDLKTAGDRSKIIKKLTKAMMEML